MIQKTMKLPIKLNAPLRFTEADAIAASNEWRFNCGPAALCAMLGLTPAELRPHMLDFESKGYTNPTLMKDVLGRLGVSQRNIIPPNVEPSGGMLQNCRYALVRIQWGGPWTRPGVPMKARYRQTHWIGCRKSGYSTEVYDVNQMDEGGWGGLHHWILRTVPSILHACVPNNDGSWWPTHILEVSL